MKLRINSPVSKFVNFIFTSKINKSKLKKPIIKNIT